MRLNADSIASSYGNYKVVLGTTGLSALDWSFSGNMNGDTTMFSGTLTIPAGLKQGDWIEIPFSKSFNYTVARNLAMKFSAQQGSGSVLNSIRGEEDAPYYSGRQATADNNTSDDVSGIGSRLADIRLKIEKRM